MSRKPLRAPSRSHGLTLVEAAIAVVVAVVVVGAVFGLLAKFTNVLSGKPATVVSVARTEYHAEWIDPPPSLLTSSGATVSYKVEARTETTIDGFVTATETWRPFKGATVTFSLKGISARLKSDSVSNVQSVAVTTGDDGVASAVLTPETNQANELRVHVRTPSGAEGDGTAHRFEVNP